MSEVIKHECGLAFLRLRKPSAYYAEKYGERFFGLSRMYALMTKLRNRGQDGAGLAYMDVPARVAGPRTEVLKSASATAVDDIFAQAYAACGAGSGPCGLQPDGPRDGSQGSCGSGGDLFLGHLRYGTFGGNNPENLHPLLHRGATQAQDLLMAGNFNLTNIDVLAADLRRSGVEVQDNDNRGDTRIVLAHTALALEKRRTLREAVAEAAAGWDGGFVFGGLTGTGEGFVLRDACGIRPAYYYMDDEIVVAASERPVLQTVFDIPFEKVQELRPGHILCVHPDGKAEVTSCLPEAETRACSFEHIYFSRGTDAQIYRERKKLGELLAPAVLRAVGDDLENTIFTPVPNTAQVAFLGLCNALSPRPRMEQLVWKDAERRVFITDEAKRGERVKQLYDVVYGQVREGRDTLVVVDDSIVRGTTLRDNILRLLDRLHPKKIAVVSTAPQIRYPDCYGFDMAKLGELVAFQAAVSLLKESGQEALLAQTYEACRKELEKPMNEIRNLVHALYAPFSEEEISSRIALLLQGESVKAEVEVIYQTVENLHEACPDNTGDWYFTGRYPTAGGNRTACRAFINYMENKNIRAY